MTGDTPGMPAGIREYFERGYAQRWGLTAPSAHIRAEAASVAGLLQLPPATRVIDIACGHGRHALVLAERGHDVIGVDLTASLLDRARHLAGELGARARWIRGDMRRLPLRPDCADGATMMDAFGFFDTEQEHEAALREAVRVLRIGGRFVLKVVNGGLILDAFRETEREEREGASILISRTRAFAPPGMTERITISGSRGSGEYERRQRLYRVEELRTLLESVGFNVVGVFANPDGTPFEPGASSTMWVVSQRGRH
jgi:ubiquinone/menaquinone biosynthesis C-methylase UbiE